MLELVPELEELLGPQPPVPALGPVAIDNRFQLTFLAFVRALATAERPVVLLVRRSAVGRPGLAQAGRGAWPPRASCTTSSSSSPGGPARHPGPRWRTPGS
jgi:hypothetical protein